MSKSQRAILFRKCLGLNDSRAIGTQKMVTNPREPEAGFTEFIDCLNVTTTPDGCVEKLAPLVNVHTAGSVVSNVSAGSRFMFAADGSTHELFADGSTDEVFPDAVGAIAHTLLDVRVSADVVYKNLNATGVTSEAVVGQYTGPAVTKSFSSVPLFKQAFAYNAKLYTVSAEDSRFVNYSEDYAYDLYNLGDSYIPSATFVIQAGAIPGVVLTTHSNGVSVYIGDGPKGEGFVKKFYPCNPYAGTLYSGFISKVYGYSHVFLCSDGVYIVGSDGVLKNLTVEQLHNFSVLNTTYSCSTVFNGKYQAFGDVVGLEYDFRTKGLLKRTTFGVTSACVWNKDTYYAAGSSVCRNGVDIDTSEAFGCSATLPFSDLSGRGKKRFDGLYFTGTANGEWSITATDQTGDSWTVERTDSFVGVTSAYIKTPKHFLGNHISVKLESLSGSFRLEELVAAITVSNRS